MLACPRLIIAYDDKSDARLLPVPSAGIRCPRNSRRALRRWSGINVLVSEFEAHVLLAHPTVSPRVVPRRLWEGQVRTL